MIRTSSATLLLALAVGGASAPVAALTYEPVGVQTNVDMTTVFGSWQTLYSGSYASSGVDLTAIYADANTQIMLAARQVGATTFSLLATIDAATLVGLHTAHNETVEANGAQWYANGLSMGFAALGSEIHQVDADVLFADGDQRLSWHTNSGATIDASFAATEIGAGWRAGNAYFAFSGWERFILTEIPDVAMPAALPLMLGGVGAFGLFARRRRRG